MKIRRMTKPKGGPAGEFQIVSGRKLDFSIDAVLPPIDGGIGISGRNPILELTDGYITFFSRGDNIFLLADQVGAARIARPSPLLRRYSPCALSMVIEWVLYDRAYQLSPGEDACFSDIVDGESTPDLRFRRDDGSLALDWDFSGWTRLGIPYRRNIGHRKTSFSSYLWCLASLVDTLIPVIGLRASLLGYQAEWRKWLDGYREERAEFEDFCRGTFSKIDLVKS